MKTNQTNTDKDVKQLAAAIAVKTMLNAEEAAFYIGCALGTLYHKSSKNEIPFCKPNGKMIYFDKADLDNWMRQNRVNSQDEAEQAAIAHVTRNKRK